MLSVCNLRVLWWRVLCCAATSITAVLQGLRLCFDRIRDRLDDTDAGVVSCAVNIICEVMTCQRPLRITTLYSGLLLGLV
jgi:hypothetical protein